MDLVLWGLQWTQCLVYINDVINPGRSFGEYLNNRQAVVQRLCEAGLKLQPKKCTFLRRQVNYLGHVVTSDGVAADPAKVDKVLTWPVPTTVKEVQQFLGFAGYYRRFVKHFADVARPLHRLTERVTEFFWTDECQAAFDELRRRLVTSPVLAYPDYTKSFTLDTDASDTGIGGVLSQRDVDGEESHRLHQPSTEQTGEELLRYQAGATWGGQLRPILTRKDSSPDGWNAYKSSTSISFTGKDVSIPTRKPSHVDLVSSVVMRATVRSQPCPL